MSSPVPVFSLLVFLLLSVLVNQAQAQIEDGSYAAFEAELTKYGSQCYGLPYGGLGFVSHIFTYYSIICCIRGIQPLTWKSLDQRHPGLQKWRERLDWLNSLVMLVIAMVSAVRTMLQCAGETYDAWQYTLMAVMKLTLTFTSAMIPVFRDRTWVVLTLIIIYVSGVVIGMVGLVSLLVIFDGNMKIIITTFCGVLLLAWVIAGIRWRRRKSDVAYQDLEKGSESRFLWRAESVRGLITSMVIILVVLAALCSDWIVADAMGGRWLGYSEETDSASQALYWIYFVGQKLVILAGIWSVQ